MPSVRPVCMILVVVAAACRNFGEPATTLAVSPPTLAFTAPIGGVGPPQQLLTVDRRGGGRLQWDATSDTPWLAIAPAQDTAPATAWVTAALQNLSIGTHHGHIVVVAGADTSLVAVTFLVTANVTLSGRWVFTGDTLNVGLELADAAGLVTGSGNFNSRGAARRFFSVQGSVQPPSVTLTLYQASGTPVTLTGSLDDDNVLDAVLNGGGFTAARITLVRQ